MTLNNKYANLPYLTIFQAALLALGVNPHEVNGESEGDAKANRPEGYYIYKNMIIGAIQFNKIAAQFAVSDGNGSYKFFDAASKPKGATGKISVRSIIDAKDLRRYFKEELIVDCFFNPPASQEAVPSYMNKNSPYFSPRLYAAIEAHSAMTAKPNLFADKHPKTAIADWLWERKNKYSIHNESQAKTIASIANWDLSGGPRKKVEKKQRKRTSKLNS